MNPSSWQLAPSCSPPPSIPRITSATSLHQSCECGGVLASSVSSLSFSCEKGNAGEPCLVETFVVGEYHLSSCPICLEHFTLDNPAIIVQCEHSFHLQCLESWRQRSHRCPVCLKPLSDNEGRVMGVQDTRRRRRYHASSGTATFHALPTVQNPDCMHTVQLSEVEEGTQGTRGRGAHDVSTSEYLIGAPDHDSPAIVRAWRWLTHWCSQLE